MKVIKEFEIFQGTYLGKDIKGNLYISGYLDSNNGNRKWIKFDDINEWTDIK